MNISIFHTREIKGKGKRKKMEIVSYYKSELGYAFLDIRVLKCCLKIQRRLFDSLGDRNLKLCPDFKEQVLQTADSNFFPY